MAVTRGRESTRSGVSRSLWAVLLLAAPAAAQVVRIPTIVAPAIGSFGVAPALSASSAFSPSFSAPALTPSLIPALRPVLSAAATPLKPSLPAAPAPSVRAFVLDLDGNAFGPGLPTKIILFRKGGVEELPVSAAEFAALEKFVGTDYAYAGVNLRDYELRGADSFREFFGPKFAADIKWAVDNLPESLWQGPSWGAMVQALSDPRTAEFVYVLTARQHTSEELLDGFRFLQSRGYIRYLPRVENLHGVGGTYRTAERKAELMAEFLDGLQERPLGPDGKLHRIGFSDDTWKNYEKMRDALLSAIRANPSRWSRVTIALFFTGIDAEHPGESIVLQNDGTTRTDAPSRPN